MWKIEKTDSYVCHMYNASLKMWAYFYWDKANQVVKLFTTRYRDFDKYTFPDHLLGDYIDNYKKNKFEVVGF